MYIKIKNLVEYAGITDELPILDNPSSFKQFCLHDNLVLPEPKSNILKVVKVVSQLVILDSRSIRTPKATSLEGQKLTGSKLIVDGMINQKIEYISDIPSQAVFAEHFSIPFCTFIILPENFKLGNPVRVSGYIEDMAVDVYEKRNIISNAILLMVVEM